MEDDTFTSAELRSMALDAALDTGDEEAMWYEAIDSLEERMMGQLQAAIVRVRQNCKKTAMTPYACCPDVMMVDRQEQAVNDLTLAKSELMYEEGKKRIKAMIEAKRTIAKIHFAFAPIFTHPHAA